MPYRDEADSPVLPPGPTTYPDVNAILRELVDGVQHALGGHLRGIYLIGSLVTGDFDPNRSDVDVLVVTNEAITDDEFAALQAVHRSIASENSPWATEVEVYYLTESALRPDDPSFGWHWKVNRGGGILEPLQLDRGWLIENHILHEYGVALEGPDPRALVGPVKPGDLRQVTADSAPEWLETILAETERLRHPGFHAYLVLTLCRMRYAIANDAVASKQVAGRWALTVDDGRWAGLVERVLGWRKDRPDASGHRTTDDDVDLTLDLIRDVIEQCAAYSKRGDTPLETRGVAPAIEPSLAE